MTPWWESLVQIRGSRGTKGSGVFISPGEILTAAHVVWSGSGTVKLSQLTLNIRYRQQSVVPRQAVVLPSWATTGTTGSDFGLIRVDVQAELGVAPVLEAPPAGSRATLSAAGFEAQTDTVRFAQGNVECKTTNKGERFLYTEDFSPEFGMSGGPVCGVVEGEVRVAGILTRRSRSNFIGLSVFSAILDELRSVLRD